MIKIVHAYLLGLLSKNNFKPLATATLVVVSITVLASFIVPPALKSTFNPGSRMASLFPNDVEVTEVVPDAGTLGRLWSGQNNITVTVKNNGTQDQTNLTVDLTVTGANAEHLTQVIPFLAAGTSTSIIFTATGTAAGSQSIEVKVPDDDDNTNNTKTVAQEITCNTLAYTGPEPVYDGFGHASGIGIIAARYMAPDVPVQVTGVTIHLSANSANEGKSISGVLLDEFGNILADGAPFIATAADLNTNIQLNFYFPTIINAGDIFYIGIRQDEAGQYPVGLALPGTTHAYRYFTFPDGGGTPTEYTDPGSFKIGVVGDIAADLSNSAVGQVEGGKQVTFTATSGFASYTFKVNGAIAQSSSDNVFTYFPADNDEVHVEINRNGCASAPIGNYVMDVRDIIPTNGIIYVNKNNPVPGDGSSWSNAVTEVADALRWAKARQANWTAASPLQIWVAGGTYKPLYSPADNNFGNEDGMNNAFLLVKNVKIYGGFAGTETTLSERDLTLTANKSILSGDYNGDDVISGSADFLNISGRFENACHVVIASGDVGVALLDGFTITGSGGDNEALNDIEVNGNTITKLAGGGLHNYLASPAYINLTIQGNTAAFYGGGIYNDQASPVFTNVLIIENLSDYRGGGMLNINLSSPVLTNVTISNNNAAVNGGGMINISSDPLIRNSIVYGNSSGIANSNSTPVITYSLVQGMTEDIPNHILDGSLDPQFANPATGNYTLKAGSPAVNAGGSLFYQAGETPDLSNISTDHSGRPRITGSSPDLGAFETATQDQNIIAQDISVTYGDADFTLTATASSGLPVSYSIANNDIADLYQDASDGNKWKIKIKKAGAVTITLSQPGDAIYDSAENVEILLLINRKELVATADDKTKAYGESIPALTVSYAGFVGSDNVQSITPPGVITTATPTSAPGVYPIILTHGDADNYEFKLVNGLLTVEGAIITIQQQPTGQIACAGATATFTTSATAAMSAPIAYQWQQSADNSTWDNIAGANNAQLSVTAVNDLYYRCVVTAPGREVNTDAAKLSVKTFDKPVINLPNTVCLSEGRLALSASIPGGIFSGAGVSGTTWNIDTLKPGGHTIQYTYSNSNGCTTTITKSVNLTLCGEKDLVTATKAQPNPTTGIVYVKALLTENAKQTIIVSSSFGQKVLQKQVKLLKGWNLVTLDLTGVGAGVYFITITGFDKTPAKVLTIIKR